MKESVFEVCATVFALACFAATRLYTDSNDALYIYIAMLAGTTAGAVIGVFGGKKFAMFDTGAEGWIAKSACHFSITIIFGPMTLQWALMKWPEMEPPAVASMVGGCLALFGTNFLILVSPMAANVVNSLLKRWMPAPIPHAPPTGEGPLSPSPAPADSTMNGGTPVTRQDSLDSTRSP